MRGLAGKTEVVAMQEGDYFGENSLMGGDAPYALNPNPNPHPNPDPNPDPDPDPKPDSKPKTMTNLKQ